MAVIKIKNPEYIEGGESDKWIPITMVTQSDADKIIITDGDGTKYLADDGTYKTVVTEVDLSPYYTKEEVDALIGDINTVLDEINGEEV